MNVRTLSLSSFLLLSAACSNGAVTGDGEVSFVLTDAASEELVQFEVDVSSIVLTRADNTTVSVMPQATRVDFVDLVSVGELVTVSTLPAAQYVSLQMNLDFSTAEVVLLGQTGPATVVDTAGNPITGTVAVQMDFSARARPLVRRGRHHLFELDLDLDQAVTVDAGANQVTFAPVLSAQIDPQNPRPVATTGILAAVDTAAGTFTVERRAIDNSPIAQFTVRTFGQTVFQVDGIVLLGANGLAAMGTHVGERVFAQGGIDPLERVVEALAVEIGAGVIGNGQDWVFGHVTARDNGAGSDATLTVLGRSFDGSTRRFNVAHTVGVALGSTKVLRRFAGNSINTNAINVGQLVFAFGDLTGTAMDCTAPTGVVRMLPTSIFGIAAGPAVGEEVTLDVVRFDLRAESAFNFTVGAVGGVGGVIEADPNAYTVDVGNLDTSTIVAGSKLQVVGFINPVGIVSDSNSTALGFADRTNGGKAMLLQWATPSILAIDDTTAESITLDIAGVVIAVVGDGFAPVAVTSSPQPVLKPLFGLGIYRIVEAGGVELHFLFDTFRRSLELRAATSGVFRVAALGFFDDTTQEFSALAATVVLQ